MISRLEAIFPDDWQYILDVYREYERKLKQVGFKVENKQVYNQLPYRWLIATK